MSTEEILYKYGYSYKINYSYSTVPTLPGTPINIEILPSPNISFIISPTEIYNAKWQDQIKFNVSIRNESSSIIENFNINLTTSANLTYVSGTLMNSNTGIYYPCTNLETNYCITESIAPNSILNLNYYLMPLPDSNTESFINNPLTAYNTTKTPSLQNTNYSYIYLSQQKLVINKSPDGMFVYIENRGTINSLTFTYKYAPPPYSKYFNAYLSGIPFTNITVSKLGSYYLFKIGPLPVSTPNNRKILVILFS